MKKNYLLLFLLFVSLLVFSCGRDEPVTAVSLPPVSADTNLVLISQSVIDVPEPSALAYNPKTNTLFTVSDGNQTVYELSLNGNVLRHMVVQGSDLEGIAFSAGYDSIFVVQEAAYTLLCCTLTGVTCYSWRIVTSADPKHGYEGVTRTPQGTLLLLNEKTPMLLLEATKQGQELQRRELNYTLDISDVSYDSSSACYWVISHESRKLLKLRTDFSLIAAYATTAVQGEGVAVVGDKIYIVSDSDSKLLVYAKPK